MNQLEFLQIELNNTQSMMGIYGLLPKRKQRKRRYFEDYCHLIKKEMFLKAQIKKEEEKGAQI